MFNKEGIKQPHLSSVGETDEENAHAPVMQYHSFTGTTHKCNMTGRVGGSRVLLMTNNDAVDPPTIYDSLTV